MSHSQAGQNWMGIWTKYHSCFPNIPLLFPLFCSCWLRVRKETLPAKKHRISFFQKESYLIPYWSAQWISALVTPGMKLLGSSLLTFQINLVWIQTNWIWCYLQSHPTFMAPNATSFALALWLALCHCFLGFLPLIFFTLAANLAYGCQKSLGLARRQSKSLVLTAETQTKAKPFTSHCLIICVWSLQRLEYAQSQCSAGSTPIC